MIKNIFKRATLQSLRNFGAVVFPEVQPTKTRNRIPAEVYENIVSALIGAENCEQIYTAYERANGFLDDQLLSLGITRVEEFNFGLDDGFNKQLIPLYTSYIKTFTKQNNQVFTDIVRCAGSLGVQDQAFWKQVKEVMVTQRMYRYIPIEEIGDVIKSFAIVGQADFELLRLLGDQVIKHKKFLPEQTKNEAKQGFQIAEIGFAEFKSALEDDEVNELKLKI